MCKFFNVSGACRPYRHYMVDLTTRLDAISNRIAHGDYFMINLGRQYGKTTLLRSLAVYLKKEYEMVFLDFQRLSSQTYQEESSFVDAFVRMLLAYVKILPENIRRQFLRLQSSSTTPKNLQVLFHILSDWCRESEKPVVLLIDEADASVNSRLFSDFFAQLRAAYLDRDVTPAFQSVILVGAHDMRNVKRKLRPTEEQRVSYPWKIAASFTVDLSFRTNEIADMLREYEKDHHTGMNVPKMAWLLYDYTSGYPVLVSHLCKIMDEVLAETPDFPEYSDAWTQKGLETAVKLLLWEQNPLFASIWEELNCDPKMKSRIYAVLFRHHTIPYNMDDPVTGRLAVAGLVKNEDGIMQISNRIFETRLYNCFLMAAEAANIEKSFPFGQ